MPILQKLDKFKLNSEQLHILYISLGLGLVTVFVKWTELALGDMSQFRDFLNSQPLSFAFGIVSIYSVVPYFSMSRTRREIIWVLVTGCLLSFVIWNFARPVNTNVFYAIRVIDKFKII